MSVIAAIGTFLAVWVVTATAVALLLGVLIFVGRWVDMKFHPTERHHHQ